MTNICSGEHDTEEREYGELKFTVGNFKIHPRYRKTTSSLDYDFALIKIPKVDLRKYRGSIRPVCLPDKAGRNAVDYGRGRVTAYGWGQESILFRDNIRLGVTSKDTIQGVHKKAAW